MGPLVRRQHVLSPTDATYITSPFDTDKEDRTSQSEIWLFDMDKVAFDKMIGIKSRGGASLCSFDSLGETSVRVRAKVVSMAVFTPTFLA